MFMLVADRLECNGHSAPLTDLGKEFDGRRTLTLADMETKMTVKLAVIYYSTYGTNHSMATIAAEAGREAGAEVDRKSTRLNSSHVAISYAVFCLKKKRNYLRSDNDDKGHR